MNKPPPPNPFKTWLKMVWRTLRPGFLKSRVYTALFLTYLALASVAGVFYLRRDVRGLAPGDMVLMDVYAPRDLQIPLSRFSETDLHHVQQQVHGRTRRVKGVDTLALGGLQEAFRVTEDAAQRAESASIVRVEETFLPAGFPLERLLVLSARDRLHIRWAAHRGLSLLYGGGVPLGASRATLQKQLQKTGAFDHLRGERNKLARQSALAFALPDTHQDLLSTLAHLRATGQGPTRHYRAGDRLLRAGQQVNEEELAVVRQAEGGVANQLALRLVFIAVVLLLTLLLFTRLVGLLDANLLGSNAFFWVATLTGVLLFVSVPVAMKVRLAYMGYALTGLLVFNALLVSALYRPLLAALVVLFQTVLLATVFNIPPRFLMPAFVVAITAIAYFKPRFNRGDLLLLGAVCAAVGGVLCLVTELSFSKPWAQVGQAVAVSVLSGLSGAVLAIGSLPLFERLFNIATANTLLELANPNHPLLRKLFLEAPGTYHHSMIMAAISEAAVEALGGDALLARVACYYHDIGKTRRPEFFTENTNPGEVSVHETLAPSLSALVIVNHVKEGIEMGRAARLPESIIRVIPAHHGTSLVSYFYNKARIQAQGQEVNENQFRYPGPKPQTLEEAVIMLADTCEASVRSLASVSLKSVEDQVDRMIKGKLEDGQLDDCSLTLQQLDVIRQVFVKTLLRIHHQRLNYDKGLQGELAKTKAKESKSAGARGA